MEPLVPIYLVRGKRYTTQSGAARLRGVSRQRVAQWVAEGKLTALRVSLRVVLVPVEAALTVGKIA